MKNTKNLLRNKKSDQLYFTEYFPADFSTTKKPGHNQFPGYLLP